MKHFVKGVVVTAILLACSTVGRSQSLEERLKQFGQDFGKGYCSPFVDAFGASLNSGWYHSANTDDGLDLFIGAQVMLMPVPDESKVFSIASPYNGTVQSIPTIFGEKTSVPISGTPSGTTPDKYPEGVDVKWTPMVVPHLSIGNIYGTRIMLRWIPEVNIADYGKFSFFGMGVQHGLNRYIPALPLDVSAMIAFQNLNVGDLITSKALTFGAQASKTLSILTVYGGLAYESSSMTFSYTADIPDINTGTTIPTKVDFDLSGTNTVRATIGLSLSLAILKISADYSLASQPVASLGVGLGW